MIKRLVFGILSLGVLMSAGLAPAVYAATGPFDDLCNQAAVDGQPNVADSSLCKENATSSASPLNPFTGEGGVLMRVIRLIAFMTGVASMIIIVLSGIKYITSGGDSNAINSAKNTLFYAIVGVIVSLMAQSIIVFVQNRIK